MAEEEMGACDADDVVCQLEVLVHLRGLKKGIGAEKFLEKFPELTGLEEKLEPKIVQQVEVIDKALAQCGAPSLAEQEGEDETPQASTEVEQPEAEEIAEEK